MGKLAVEMSKVKQDRITWGGMHLCRLGQGGWAEREKEEGFFVVALLCVCVFFFKRERK